MISLILPYWNRQAAADKAFQLLAKQYSGIDLEIIVVDDGNRIPFRVPDVGLQIRVINLPIKDEPKCPATAWNAGVKAAIGDVIVLSCIEILHETPILEELASHVREHPDNYVLASAWCPEEQAWHCHSSVTVPDCKPDSGIAFCAALTPELFNRVGGFDETYREGAGYEDRDFIRRLEFHGARFIKRDDLVVIHPKSGASISWGDEKFQRNQALFELKWPTSPLITFVCLNAGNYCGRGAEYVNNLADMVKRNMPACVRWKFVCLTDDATGLDPNIELLPLPEDLKGWWGKLYLFKKGLFPDGSRMVFFDLDTVLLSSLENIIKYDGEMAILRDFYQPQRGAPGVILWRAGSHSRIWDEWVANGKPLNPMGDLGWIEGLDQGRFTRTLDRLQDLFPESFVSFKAHCNPYPPKGSTVVCFHGQPRPHNCGQAWVEQIWKVGGGKTPELVREINTRSNVLADNVKSSCSRGLPQLGLIPEHGMTAIIVGGGPSLKDSVEKIRKMNGTIIALNNTAKFLIDNGIQPNIQMFLDARKENVQFIADCPRYLVASTCAPEMFEALEGRHVEIYHPHIPGIESYLPGGESHLIGGGSTVGMLALGVAYMSGYRKFELFGYDSSYAEGNHHAYAQSLNDGENCVDVTCEGRTFRCAAWMATQAQEFQETSLNLIQMGCEIQVHGTGLLPYLAWQMTRAA